MASTLKKFDFPETHSRQSHPWEVYMDGDIRRLKKGKDYQGDSANFCTLCRTKGKDAGVKVKTAVEYEGEGDDKADVSVVVQFATEVTGTPAKKKKKDKKDKKKKDKKEDKVDTSDEGEDSDDF